MVTILDGKKCSEMRLELLKEQIEDVRPLPPPCHGHRGKRPGFADVRADEAPGLRTGGDRLGRDRTARRYDNRKGARSSPAAEPGSGYRRYPRPAPPPEAGGCRAGDCSGKPGKGRGRVPPGEPRPPLLGKAPLHSLHPDRDHDPPCRIQDTGCRCPCSRCRPQHRCRAADGSPPD